MTINTDSVRVKNGTDYSFVCGKIPFAITCSSTLQHGSYNLIDLDIVNKMKIPLQKIKVFRLTYMGENLRSVGYIDQTIQCVQNGVIQGTVHLSAKVVRNLFENFNVDCIASSKTYERLTGTKPPDPPHINNTEDRLQDDDDEDIFSSGSSSTCSDGRHDPITKDWLFKASLIASAAQKDDEETLLQCENEKANVNVIEDDEDDQKSSSEEGNENDIIQCAKTKTEDEEKCKLGKLCHENCVEEEGGNEFHCWICFQSGKPYKIVSNHHIDCPTCPSVTPEMKTICLGPNWKTDAEYIMKMRHQRQKEKETRRSHARP